MPVRPVVEMKKLVVELLLVLAALPSIQLVSARSRKKRTLCLLIGVALFCALCAGLHLLGWR